MDNKTKSAKLTDLQFDETNINKRSEYGGHLLEKSITEVGLGRSILLDRNNNIIAGNQTAQKAGELGIDNVRIIETTGDEIIAVKRMDVDINSQTGAKLKIFDNTVQKHNYVEDVEVAAIVCADYEIVSGEIGLKVVDTSSFTPNTEPEYSHKNVTDQDVTNAGEKLTQQMEAAGETREVICPECAHEFHIKVKK